MESFNRKIFNDILDVINNLPNHMRSNIPQDVIKSLEQNKDPNYISNIDFSDKNWYTRLNQETLKLLALLYRDYIVSKEEHDKLLNFEKKIYIEREEEKRQKYNISDLFKNKKQ